MAVQGCLQGSGRLLRYSGVKRGRSIAVQGCLQGSGRLWRYIPGLNGVAVLRSREFYRGPGRYCAGLSGTAVLRSRAVYRDLGGYGDIPGLKGVAELQPGLFTGVLEVIAIFRG